MAGKAAVVEDDDVTQGPDKPEDAETTTEDGMDLDVDGSDDEDEEDETAAGTPTVAQLTAQLKAATDREKRANAAATAAAQRAIKERKTRKAAGVDRNGKVTAAGAETDPEDRSTWPEAARKAVEKSEREAAEAKERRDASTAKAVDRAIRDGLTKAGLVLPEDADEARLTLKRVMRAMDTETITVDDDGDIVGVEDEIDAVRMALPNLFSDDITKVLDAKDVVDKKPRVNPGGGTRTPAAGAGNKKMSAAEYLVSDAYKNRNRK